MDPKDKEEVVSVSALSSPAGEGSIFSHQLRLRDEMLAAPVHPDTSSHKYHSAMFCNSAAELMAAEPAPEYAQKLKEQIQEYKQMEPDETRLRILNAMYENYTLSLRDPLNFRAPEEIAIVDGLANRLQGFFHRIEAIDAFLNAIYLSRVQGKSNFTAQVAADLEDIYSKHPMELQAGLLLSYFSNSRIKDDALSFLKTWFGDCDLKADIRVLDVYFEAGKAHDSLAGLLVKHLPKLSSGKNIESATIREAAEHEAKRKFEVERKMRDRAGAGTCVMCGKPLGWAQKLFGQKQHKACTVFTE